MVFVVKYFQVSMNAANVSLLVRGPPVLFSSNVQCAELDYDVVIKCTVNSFPRITDAVGWCSWKCENVCSCGSSCHLTSRSTQSCASLLLCCALQLAHNVFIIRSTIAYDLQTWSWSVQGKSFTLRGSETLAADGGCSKLGSDTKYQGIIADGGHSSSLLVTGVQQQDLHTYSCTVTNSYGSNSKEYSLKGAIFVEVLSRVVTIVERPAMPSLPFAIGVPWFSNTAEKFDVISFYPQAWPLFCLSARSK